MKQTIGEYRNLNLKDHYLIRQYNDTDFQYIVDIGASTGIFTDIARFRFPESHIYAFEPCRQSLVTLRQRVEPYYGVSVFDYALGSGEPLYFVENECFLDNTFVSTPEEGSAGYPVESKNLVEIFDLANIPLDSNFMVKMDCEGGEACLLDGHADHIIRKAKHVCMEIHFKGTKDDSRFEFFRTYEEYNEWIRNSFSETHDIIYHVSNRHRGYGHFILTLKNDTMKKLTE